MPTPRPSLLALRWLLPGIDPFERSLPRIARQNYYGENKRITNREEAKQSIRRKV